MRPSEWWVVGGIWVAAVAAAALLLAGLLFGLVTF